MAKQTICQADPSKWEGMRTELLLQRATPVTMDNLAEARRVAEDLADTVRSQSLAIGLAANQINSPLAVAMIAVEDYELIMFNPQILSATGKKDRKRESCMSVWGLTGEVERREKIKLSYQDYSLSVHEIFLKGFISRVAQHEVDHLNGKLYTSLVHGEIRSTDLFAGHSPVRKEV